MPTYKIFSFFLWLWLFPKIKIYYAFIAHEVQEKTHFLNGFSTKTCKHLHGLKFNLCTSILLTIQKFITKFNP